MRHLPTLAALLIGLGLAALAPHGQARPAPPPCELECLTPECNTDCQQPQNPPAQVPPTGIWTAAQTPYPCDQPGDVCADWIDQYGTAGQCCIPYSFMGTSQQGICSDDIELLVR